MTSPIKRDLHPAVVHLLLACFSAIGFAIIAADIQSGHRLTAFDAQQATRIYDYSVRHPEVWNFAVTVTDLGSGRPRTVVVIGVAIILLLQRQCRLALLWAATQWLLKEVVGLTKNWFERPRPHFDIASYSASGWSFPSGHACGVMATYGMIGFLIAWRWPGKWFTWLAIFGLGAIILLVGLSRMLLGVHWFTDILGGYLLGLTWISLCVAAVEWHRSKIQVVAG